MNYLTDLRTLSVEEIESRSGMTYSKSLDLNSIFSIYKVLRSVKRSI